MRESDVVVVEYDPQWPERFERETTRVRSVLGEMVVMTEHFGSTAVPGLAAKPIVDFIVLIEEKRRAPGAVDALEARGYRVWKEWKHRTVLRRAARDGLQFNLHLCWPETIPEIEGNLAFREFLRDNPSMRERYGEVKRRAANEFPDDVVEYYRAKNPVVEEIVERAEAAGYVDRIDLPST